MLRIQVDQLPGLDLRTRYGIAWNMLAREEDGNWTAVNRGGVGSGMKRERALAVLAWLAVMLNESGYQLHFGYDTDSFTATPKEGVDLVGTLNMLVLRTQTWTVAQLNNAMIEAVSDPFLKVAASAILTDSSTTNQGETPCP